MYVSISWLGNRDFVQIFFPQMTHGQIKNNSILNRKGIIPVVPFVKLA